jgi:hypothetical protein
LPRHLLPKHLEHAYTSKAFEFKVRHVLACMSGAQPCMHSMLLFCFVLGSACPVQVYCMC